MTQAAAENKNREGRFGKRCLNQLQEEVKKWKGKYDDAVDEATELRVQMEELKEKYAALQEVSNRHLDQRVAVMKEKREMEERAAAMKELQRDYKGEADAYVKTLRQTNGVDSALKYFDDDNLAAIQQKCPLLFEKSTNFMRDIGGAAFVQDNVKLSLVLAAVISCLNERFIWPKATSTSLYVQARTGSKVAVQALARLLPFAPKYDTLMRGLQRATKEWVSSWAGPPVVRDFTLAIFDQHPGGRPYILHQARHGKSHEQRCNIHTLVQYAEFQNYEDLAAIQWNEEYAPGSNLWGSLSEFHFEDLELSFGFLPSEVGSMRTRFIEVYAEYTNVKTEAKAKGQPAFPPQATQDKQIVKHIRPDLFLNPACYENVKKIRDKIGRDLRVTGFCEDGKKTRAFAVVVSDLGAAICAHAESHLKRIIFSVGAGHEHMAFVKVVMEITFDMMGEKCYAIAKGHNINAPAQVQYLKRCGDTRKSQAFLADVFAPALREALRDKLGQGFRQRIEEANDEGLLTWLFLVDVLIPGMKAFWICIRTENYDLAMQLRRIMVPIYAARGKTRYAAHLMNELVQYKAAPEEVKKLLRAAFSFEGMASDFHCEEAIHRLKQGSNRDDEDGCNQANYKLQRRADIDARSGNIQRKSLVRKEYNLEEDVASVKKVLLETQKWDIHPRRKDPISLDGQPCASLRKVLEDGKELLEKFFAKEKEGSSKDGMKFAQLRAGLTLQQLQERLNKEFERYDEEEVEKQDQGDNKQDQGDNKPSSSKRHKSC